MDMYAYTFAIDTRYFYCVQSRSVLGFRLVPLPQMIAEFCPTGMTQILVLFMENPCMFMVFIRKRCVISNFHDFLWQFTPEHVQTCCFFHVLKSSSCGTFRQQALVVHPSRQPSNHPNSTAVHRFARTSFLGLVEKIRQGSSQYLSCRYRMTIS